MTFFGNYDEAPSLREAEVPPATGKSGQRIRVGVVERDNGLVMAKTSQISNALYDLADQNSTTHTVLLPHGTTVKLSAATAPNVGSWRAKFEVSNPKLGKTVVAKGTSEASELAGQIDLLALAKVDKDALAKVTELWEAGLADELMIELGLREAPLAEADVHVSGYVTKNGRHVGAYSQIRATLQKLEHGQTAHFPDGISAKKVKPDAGPATFELAHTGKDGKGGMASRFAGEASATSIIASRSARSTHPDSLGGTTSHKGVETSQQVSALTADNPKLPGAPHPDAVAAKAAAARKSAKLPSRKERARNESVAKTTADVRNLKNGESIEVGTSRIRRNDLEPPTTPSGRKANVKGGTTYEVTGPGGRRGTGVWTDPEKAAKEAHSRHEGNSNSRRPKPGVSADDGPVNMGVMKTPGTSKANRDLEAKRQDPRTTPSGLPLPPGPTKRTTSGGPGQRDDPSFASHRSNSDAAFGDVSKKTVEGWSDRILSREIDANPGRTPKERAHLKVMQAEYRRRKTASAQRRGFIGG